MIDSPSSLGPNTLTLGVGKGQKRYTVLYSTLIERVINCSQSDHFTVRPDT